MIIWSGLGFLVAAIGFAALIFTELVSEKITGDDQFYQQHGWVILIGMLVAGTLTYGLHRLLLLQKGRAVIDKETGQEVVLRSNHSLFFISVKWWPVVFALLGVVFAIVAAAR
jgi:ABC-type antimicrobial peptide transport system permease subunit